MIGRRSSVGALEKNNQIMHKLNKLILCYQSDKHFTMLKETVVILDKMLDFRKEKRFRSYKNIFFNKKTLLEISCNENVFFNGHMQWKVK